MMIATLYNQLNLDKKRELVAEYRHKFDQRSESRFYKLLKKPSNLTAEEGIFFTEKFNCTLADLLRDSQEPIAESLGLSK